MIDIILSLLCIIGYRLRGSSGEEENGERGWVEKIFGYAPGTFLGRFFWCIPFATLMTPSLLLWLPCVILAYVGVMFGYWGEFDLSLKKNRNLKNYSLLTLRGGFIALPICLLAGHWLAIAGGMLFVPCYLLGNVVSKFVKIPLLHGHTEWGEAFLATAIIIGSAL